MAKYLLLLLLFANICAQFMPLSFLADPLFYGTMTLGALGLLTNFKYISSKNIRATWILWYLIAVYISYQLTFGINYSGTQSLLWLISKVLVLLIIFWAVVSDFKFYFNKLVPIISLGLGIFIFIGYFFYHTYQFQGRFTYGFGGPNSLSAISTLVFAASLLYRFKSSWMNYLGMLIGLMGVLGGGSRISLAVLVIAILLKYKFSVKTLMLGLGCLIIAVVVLPSLGFESQGIERLTETIEQGNFANNREIERKATSLMIAERPIQGWGYNTGIQGNALEISHLGAHSGYLETIKAMGYPFAIVLFIGLFVALKQIYPQLKSNDPATKFHLFVVISILISANYESYLIGVNQIMTNMFFVSLAVLLYKTKMKIV